jgi:hypothetical protein
VAGSHPAPGLVEDGHPVVRPTLLTVLGSTAGVTEEGRLPTPGTPGKYQGRSPLAATALTQYVLGTSPLARTILHILDSASVRRPTLMVTLGSTAGCSTLLTARANDLCNLDPPGSAPHLSGLLRESATATRLFSFWIHPPYRRAPRVYPVQLPEPRERS